MSDKLAEAATMGRPCWLMKSEPDVYSIDTLKAQGTTLWDGVRNFQARNLMKNEMQVGDLVLFYHSNAKPPGVAGLAKVSTLAVPDPSQFDRKNKYYDASSSPDNPKWHCVEVKYARHLPEFVPLQALKETPGLETMIAIQKGARLSVQPITKAEYDTVCGLGGI